MSWNVRLGGTPRARRRWVNTWGLFSGVVEVGGYGERSMVSGHT